MSAERKSDLENDGVESRIVEESEVDLYSFHEQTAGRLVVDPEEAKVEFGETFASRLKLSADGTKVLWPQPTDSPDDPQNWSDRHKSLLLVIITLAAVVPDFDSGIGIAAIFKLAVQYDTTPGVINNLTSNWSIFLLGRLGGLTAHGNPASGPPTGSILVPAASSSVPDRRDVSPNLKTFAAMRCLTAFFGTAPQVTGLYVVTDLYPFHLQARMLNFWTMGFIISPFISPFALGFLVARTSWRWAYGIGSIYGAIVVLLIVFFMEETIYDRNVRPIPERPTTGFRYRIETLVGLTGLKMQKHRPSWAQAIVSPLNVVWRPHIFGLLVFEALLFGFGIGINVTNAVFLGSPPPVGFGWSEYAIAGAYGTPIVAVILGELIGRYTNDWLMNLAIRRNKGVFEAETRLWACYVALPLYIVGFVVLGASFQKHLSAGGIVMGWGLAEVAIMINTVAVYAYCNDAFPKNQGEVSALINLCRVLGGFAVAYFQVPWATKNGAFQVFGVEAAIVAGLFLLIVPALQLKGRSLREHFSLE
ncbi:major facilitator superfamily domain-containing protein [Mycena haematopus]|nr:major facilitator superfamily domain-containing protein [Mycena haematopus]